jgi:hypothetical protein
MKSSCDKSSFYREILRTVQEISEQDMFSWLEASPRS